MFTIILCVSLFFSKLTKLIVKNKFPPFLTNFAGDFFQSSPFINEKSRQRESIPVQAVRGEEPSQC
ncbi:MAG: hypothetical protein K2G84_05145, partial [Muribaculaceae bacterium]|nr:hypothetical protein [Muribaculaceae bacterium]